MTDGVTVRCASRRHAIARRVLQRHNDTIAPRRLPGRWRRWSDRREMGCSHAKTCPLFPLLNASLRGWRESFCDSEARWRECTRYQLASRGQLVPISLLPNGADARHIRNAAERSAAAEPTPPAPLISGAPGSEAWFEPTPIPESARPVEAPVQRHEPSSQSRANRVPNTPPAPERKPQSTRPRSSKRRWWTRLAEWMRGPS